MDKVNFTAPQVDQGMDSSPNIFHAAENIVKEGAISSMQNFMKMLSETNVVFVEAIRHSEYNLENTHEWVNIQKEFVALQTQAMTEVLQSIQKETYLVIQDLKESEIHHQLMKHKLAQNSLISLGHLDLSNLGGVTDHFLEFISSTNKDLQSLDLTGCTNLTGKSIPALLKNCPKLTSLKVEGCGPWDAVIRLDCNAALSEDSICGLIVCCPKVACIVLSGNQNTTDKVLNFISHCSDLEELYLQSCKKITDQGIQSLSLRCPKLWRINLHDTNIQNITINQNIIFLVLSNCPNLTDQSLQSTLQNCNKLTWLDLGLSTKITDVGLTNLSGLCPDLEQLHLSDTQISSQFLQVYVGLCPKLTCLSYGLNVIDPEILHNIRIELQLPKLKILAQSRRILPVIPR